MKENEDGSRGISRMSLAARKAWETRRKKSGNGKKQEKRVKAGKSGDQEEELVIEQLKRGYRKGMLVPKPKDKGMGVRKSSVKMDDKMFMYLYGSRVFEDICLRKLVKMHKKMCLEILFNQRQVWENEVKEVMAGAGGELQFRGKEAVLVVA